MKAPLLFLLSLACTVHCQPAAPAPAPGSPEANADAQLVALKAGDWQKFTALMHSKALTRFKDLLLPVAEALAKADKPGIERLRTALFADIPVERLKASTPEIFFERFMQNFARMTPGFVEGYKTTTVQYLGQVREGDAVHLVVRYSRDIVGTKVSEVGVSSFEQENGEWKALLSGELEQLLARLRAQYLPRQ